MRLFYLIVREDADARQSAANSDAPEKSSGAISVLIGSSQREIRLSTSIT
jgi:hypothetical protein